MTDAPLPQANPGATYLAQKEEIDEAVARVLAGGRYILGEEVAAFEAEFATYLGVRLMPSASRAAPTRSSWHCGPAGSDRSTRSSHPPTRRSPRSRRSSGPGPDPC